MNRDEWKVSYSGSALALAAEKKGKHHAERLTWWEGEHAKVMQEVRDEGIEVSESVAQTYSNSTGMGPQVMVRTDLQRKLTECHQKKQEHAQKVREYDGWQQMMGANLNNSFDLHSDDWLYFFGK